MSALEFPERLRLAAAPGSALESGLSAARTRGPSDAELRALETSLAVALGTVAIGAVAATSGAAPVFGTAVVPAVPALVAPVPALLSVGVLKATAVAALALAATTGGVAMRRHVTRARTAAVAVVAAERVHRARVSAAIPASLSVPVDLPFEVAPPVVVAEKPVVADSLISPTPPQRQPAAPDALPLIQRAQHLLARDPAQALALVEQDQRALAQSAFAQEAEVIAVAALARLGRTEEAAARAGHFLARFPDSVHALRMRRAAAIIK